MQLEQRLEIKQIHRFAIDFLRSRFYFLLLYEAFNMRVNHLNDVFKHLLESLLFDYCHADCQSENSLVDSIPIIICLGKRADSATYFLQGENKSYN